MARQQRTGEQRAQVNPGDLVVMGTDGNVSPATPEDVAAGKRTAEAVAAPAPRRDSFQCPACRAFGCPRTGARVYRFGIKRFRRCSACGHTFGTVARWLPGSASKEGQEQLDGATAIRRAPN
jgi:hypothetical protein